MVQAGCLGTRKIPRNLARCRKNICAWCICLGELRSNSEGLVDYKLVTFEAVLASRGSLWLAAVEGEHGAAFSGVEGLVAGFRL